MKKREYKVNLENKKILCDSLIESLAKGFLKEIDEVEKWK